MTTKEVVGKNDKSGLYNVFCWVITVAVVIGALTAIYFSINAIRFASFAITVIVDVLAVATILFAAYFAWGFFIVIVILYYERKYPAEGDF